ncbi:hypothetical protein NUSPORA_00117 [Nucleospora cyclopteri]
MFDNNEFDRYLNTQNEVGNDKQIPFRQKVEQLQEKGETLRDYFDDIIKNKKKYDKIKSHRELTIEEINFEKLFTERLNIFLNLSEKFIRPRKNGYGKFSVEDYVKYNLAKDAIIRGQPLDVRTMETIGAAGKKQPTPGFQYETQPHPIEQSPQFAINKAYSQNRSFKNEIAEILNEFDAKQSQISRKPQMSASYSPRPNIIQQSPPKINLKNMPMGSQTFQSPVMRYPPNIRDINPRMKDSQFLAPQNILLSNMAMKSAQSQQQAHYQNIPMHFNQNSPNKTMSPVLNPQNLKRRSNFIDEPPVLQKTPPNQQTNFIQKNNLNSMAKTKVYANKFVNSRVPTLKPSLSYRTRSKNDDIRIPISEYFAGKKLNTCDFYSNLSLEENVALKLDGYMHRILNNACLISGSRKTKKLLKKDVEFACDKLQRAVQDDENQQKQN